jgi:periplasmic protein TonB
MGVYTHSDTNWLQRRGAFVAWLIGFHVVLLWALMSGFAVTLLETIAPPIKVDIINEEKPEEPPPVSVPPVLVDIQMPSAAPAITVTNTPPPPGPPAPVSFGPPAPRPSTVVPSTVSFRPDTADYYPPTSIQLEEEGRPRVKICYGTNGRVTEVTLAESSGKKRLDDAAIRMGRQFRFKAGTVDGVAQEGCANQPIVFKMTGDR